MEKSDKKINILYFINGLGSGGTERQFVELIKNLDRDKINSTVVYYRDDTFYKNEIETTGIKIIYLPKRVRDKFLIFPLIRFIGELCEIIKKNEIDIIHSFNMSANIWARIVGKLVKRKIVISIRNTKLEVKENIIDKLLLKFNLSRWYLVERFLSRYADRVIVNSDTINCIYHNKTGLKSSKIITVTNGFDFKKITSLDDQSKENLFKKYFINRNIFYIINVGRVTEQKNQLCLLKAAKILADKKVVKFKIIIAGKIYDYFKVLDNFIKENNLSDFVEFIGEQKDIYPIIKVADLFVLSSLWEGFPNVVMEAMAIGTPVLSSDIDGIEALIKDGRTGLLFKSNNENDLALKIESFLKMPEEKIKAMTGKARIHVENNFSISKKADEYLKVYLDCLK